MGGGDKPMVSSLGAFSENAHPILSGDVCHPRAGDAHKEENCQSAAHFWQMDRPDHVDYSVLRPSLLEQAYGTHI